MQSSAVTRSSLILVGLAVAILGGSASATARGSSQGLQLEHFCGTDDGCDWMHRALREEASRAGFVVDFHHAEGSWHATQELDIIEYPSIAVFQGAEHIGTIRGYRSPEALRAELGALAYAVASGSLRSRSELLATSGAIPQEGRVLQIDLNYESGRMSVARIRDLAGAPPRTDDGSRHEYVVQLLDREERVLFARGWSPVRHIVAPPPRPGDSERHSFTRDQLEAILLLPSFPSAVEMRIWHPYGVEALRAAVPETPTTEAALGGRGQRVELLYGKGNDDKRLVILALGDRYKKKHSEKFMEDAARQVENLLSAAPISGRKNRKKIKIYAGEKINGLKCKHNCAGIQRLICCKDNKVLQAAAASGLNFDEILVLVNKKSYGGSGGITPGGGGPESYATAFTGDLGPQVGTHEFGHSAFALMDEYEYGTEGVPYGPNCAEAPCPWSGPGLGCFPGCSYNGLSRPTDRDCLMNVLAPPGGFHFCPVCSDRARSVIKRLAK